MEPKRRRELAIGVAAILIAGVAIYQIRSATPSADAEIRARVAAAAPKPPSKADLTEVELAALTARRPEPVETSRNPFRFKPKPPPPPPPPPPPVATQPAPPVGPPPPPRIALKFIGILESKRAGRVAILSDARGVYQGHEGETIEGRYRILRIGVESIDLAYVDGRGRQTIRLTGQ